MTLLLALLLAQAAEAPPPDKPPQGELPQAAAIHARKKLDPSLRKLEGRLAAPVGKVAADDVVDEMVDEFAADLTRLGAAQVGPVLLQRVSVSQNVNPAYARVLEARLAAALSHASGIAMVRCVECNATRSRVENGEWIISNGLTTRGEAQALARRYSARTFLEVDFTYVEPSAMSMDVEMVRADDQSIAFAEQYRLDVDKALLYRGADRAQAREERLRELEDRINGRPHYSQVVELGAMRVPTTDSAVWGAVGRYNLLEQFGEDNVWEAGFSLGGFLNTDQIAGGLLGAVIQARIGEALAVPKWIVAMSAGAFVTGNAGTAPIFGAKVRWMPAQRMAFHFGGNYLVPFDVKNHGTYGGFCPEAGITFSWN